MLDYTKLFRQIEEVGIDAMRETEQDTVLEQARVAFDHVSSLGDKLDERLDISRGLVLWPLANPLEPFGSQFALPEPPENHCVVAVDGSQILPSHHEVHNCYLLNIGTVTISYGTGSPARLESTPYLYHRSEELYPLIDRRRIHVDETFVSLERMVVEIESLARCCVEEADGSLPVVAFLDGSLIPWSVEKMPEGCQQHFLDRIERAMFVLEEARIPLIGYVSHSRSSEVVNLLRTVICPYEITDCRKHCGELNEEAFPCSTIWPLVDRRLYSASLSSMSRGNLFESSAYVTRSYAPNSQVCFTYAQIESEIARVELPKWLVEDHELLELALGTVRSQVVKGRGYPIALSEAHHQAVVKGPERDRFFNLMTDHLVSLGVERIQPSPKEARKKTGFV